MSYLYGVRGGQGGGRKADRRARQRELRENTFNLTPDYLNDLERKTHRVVAENVPVHASDPTAEKYPGSVMIVNARVMAALIQAARRGIER